MSSISPLLREESRAERPSASGSVRPVILASRRRHRAVPRQAVGPQLLARPFSDLTRPARRLSWRTPVARVTYEVASDVLAIIESIISWVKSGYFSISVV